MPTTDGRWRAYVAGRCVLAERWEPRATVTVVLHGAGSAAGCELDRCRTLVAGPLCAIDLPGHGDDTGDLMDPALTAQALQTVIASLNVPAYRLWGRGLGAAVALEWAADAWAGKRPLPQALTLCELKLWADDERAYWPARYTLPVTPDWDGSYLIRLWHQIRDRELFHPWFERVCGPALPRLGRQPSLMVCLARRHGQGHWPDESDFFSHTRRWVGPRCAGAARALHSRCGLKA